MADNGHAALTELSVVFSEGYVENTILRICFPAHAFEASGTVKSKIIALAGIHKGFVTSTDDNCSEHTLNLAFPDDENALQFICALCAAL